jgi:predicted HTH domain antitoxin
MAPGISRHRGGTARGVKAVGDWKLEHYARQYGDGRITLARAARQAGVSLLVGVSLWEIMDYAQARKIPAQYDLEDLKRDLKGLYSTGVRR